MDDEKLQKSATTDGLPPRPGFENAPAPAPAKGNGQHEAYWILSEEERAKGFVRPVRRSYVHLKCGGVTSMGQAIAETYARDPSYYGATFCCQCGTHFGLLDAEGNRTFRWVDQPVDGPVAYVGE